MSLAHTEAMTKRKFVRDEDDMVGFGGLINTNGQNEYRIMLVVKDVPDVEETQSLLGLRRKKALGFFLTMYQVNSDIMLYACSLIFQQCNCGIVCYLRCLVGVIIDDLAARLIRIQRITCAP